MLLRALIIVLISLLAACGQKGDLYLPDHPQPAEPAAQADEDDDGE